MKIVLNEEEVAGIVIRAVIDKLEMSCGNAKFIITRDSMEDLIFEGVEIEINE